MVSMHGERPCRGRFSCPRVILSHATPAMTNWGLVWCPCIYLNSYVLEWYGLEYRLNSTSNQFNTHGLKLIYAYPKLEVDRAAAAPLVCLNATTPVVFLATATPWAPAPPRSLHLYTLEEEWRWRKEKSVHGISMPGLHCLAKWWP